MSSRQPVIGYFDGCCEPSNPGGYACGGFIVRSHPTIPNGLRGCQFFVKGDCATNNVAEYEAALLCLRAIHATGWRGDVHLYGDSQLVIKQYDGSFACNKPHLQSLLRKLHKAETCFSTLVLKWIPREQNEEADMLSRKAYNDARRCSK